MCNEGKVESGEDPMIYTICRRVLEVSTSLVLTTNCISGDTICSRVQSENKLR